MYIAGVLIGLSCATMQKIEDGFDMKQHVESVLQETGMAGLRPRNMSVDDLLTSVTHFSGNDLISYTHMMFLPHFPCATQFLQWGRLVKESEASGITRGF